jgi:hypothetical protein
VEAPIGILYEHPLWFEPLFAELERREIAYEKLHAGKLVFDPGEPESRFSVVLNRMSPSAWTLGRRARSSTASTSSPTSTRSGRTW